MVIPKGYKILIVNPEGEILETVDLGGVDLSKPLAISEVVREIRDEIGKDVIRTISL